MAATINSLPREILDRIASYASSDNEPTAIRVLSSAKTNIFESLRFSRTLASCFLMDYAWNNYIELTSIGILHMKRCPSVLSHHTFGHDMVLLPFPTSKIRNLQVHVYMGWERDNDKPWEDVNALTNMLELLMDSKEFFPSLRNLTIKLEWVAPFASAVNLSLLNLTIAGGEENVFIFHKLFSAFLGALHDAKVANKTIICEQTGSKTNFSPASVRTVMLEMASQVMVPGCETWDGILRDTMVAALPTA